MTEKDVFNPGDFLPYLLNQAAETASLSFQQAYKDRYGMLRTEWRVLFHLGVYGRMTARDICGRAKLHKTKVSRAVQKLSEKRFLTRERDEEDRRQEYLDLTPAGQKAYRDLNEIAERHDAELRAALTTDEARALIGALRKLAEL